MGVSKTAGNICWKTSAGFLLSASLPFFLLELGLSLIPAFIIAAVAAIILGVLFSHRKKPVINGVELTEKENSVAVQDNSDLIDQSLDHLTNYFSKTIAPFGDVSGVATECLDQGAVEKVYNANLVTGEPVAADIFVLPKRSSTELVTSARLVGEMAREVFDKAVQKVIGDLEKMKDMEGLSDSDRGIIDFQIVILHDPSLSQEVDLSLESGENLLATISRTFDTFIKKLEASNNHYMKGRAFDFDDLKQRLFDGVHETTGQDGSDRFAGCEGKIAVCEHVFPSEVINLYNAGVKGILSRENTPSSHAQILLSSLNIPSATSIPELPVNKLKGHRVLINPLKGLIVVDPRQAQVDKAIQTFREQESDIIEESISLKDGKRVYVGVTVNNARIEAGYAKQVCPDFVGLYRTEMHFIDQKELPTEEELVEEYSILMSAFPEELVVIRMLDLGGDKISGFENRGVNEENPCMGLRSMRFLLQNPAIFRLQLRAILKVSHKQTCLLYPMVSGWDELEEINKFIERTVVELQEEGHEVLSPLKGIMVEVPAIVTRFEDYVDHFDVFNIGTNDLTQYTLAADRNNDSIQDYYKSCHPSILSMIAKVANQCRDKGKKAVVCGQMAAEAQVLPLLIGLGIENISVNWSAVSSLKRSLSALSYEECKVLADRALSCSKVVDVEKILGF